MVLEDVYMILHNNQKDQMSQDLQHVLLVFAQLVMNCLDYCSYISKTYYCMFLVKIFDLAFLDYFDFNITYNITYNYLSLIMYYLIIVTYQFCSQFKWLTS